MMTPNMQGIIMVIGKSSSVYEKKRKGRLSVSPIIVPHPTSTHSFHACPLVGLLLCSLH